MIPLVFSLAWRISRISARLLASLRFTLKSGSCIPIPEAEITPMPPSFAPAEASPDNETPTPMPPWIIGILAFRLPIFMPDILFFGIPHLPILLSAGSTRRDHLFVE